eukprot:3983720-Alexandrium_andersonii.AAC.1
MAGGPGSGCSSLSLEASPGPGARLDVPVASEVPDRPVVQRSAVPGVNGVEFPCPLLLCGPWPNVRTLEDEPGAGLHS